MKNCKQLRSILTGILCGLTVASSLATSICATSPIPEVEESQKVYIETINRVDFDGLSEVNTAAQTAKVNDANGFVALDGLDATLEDGALHCKATTSSAFFDMQYWNISNFPKIKEDIIFSMKIKPLTADFKVDHLIDYRFHTGEWDMQNRINIVNCELKINGTVVGTLPLNEFSLVEFAFHYDKENTQYDKVYVLLNGTEVGSVDIQVTVTRMDHLRLCRYSKGEWVVDDLVLSKGNTSLIYAGGKEPETETTEAPVTKKQEEVIPVIDYSQLVDIQKIATFDFNDWTSINNNASESKNHNGFAALDNLNCSLKNGAMAVNGTAGFFDLQFFTVESFPNVKKDVILSMKIKPTSDDLTIGQMMQFREQQIGTWDEATISLSNSKLKVNGNVVGDVPVGVYSLIEFAFHYDSELQAYDRLDILLNGVKVTDVGIIADVSVVNHFRMCRYLSGSFEVDDIVLAEGMTSLVYDREGREAPETEEKSTEDKKETEIGETEKKTEPSATTAVETKETTQKSGCGSALGCTSALIVCALGGAILCKKKKHED